jgi:SAM-dependent methyltransferase
MSEPRFGDHFSARSAGYATFRPTYPPELFDWLAGHCPARETAWDCATGSGQAAIGLARRFDRVVATDASASQIANAPTAPNIEYQVAPAEASGLPDHSADLITVAQALHWLDRPRFFAEVERVGRPGALLACWMYGLMRITPAVDAVVARLYWEIVGSFWPTERALVESAYRTIEIPFPELDPPAFTMTFDWTLTHIVGYLRTWSAVTRYAAARAEDPVGLVADDLAQAWGESDTVRPVAFPLAVRVAIVGRPETAVSGAA